jgi:hypothetical protein
VLAEGVWDAPAEACDVPFIPLSESEPMDFVEEAPAPFAILPRAPAPAPLAPIPAPVPTFQPAPVLPYFGKDHLPVFGKDVNAGQAHP